MLKESITTHAVIGGDATDEHGLDELNIQTACGGRISEDIEASI